METISVQGLQSLEVLHLPYHKVHSIQRNDFMNNSKLQKLFLDGNQITQVYTEDQG